MAGQKRNQWVVKVHDDMLRTGVSMSAREAVAIYGRPPGETHAATLLSNAKRDGWFTGVQVSQRECRYTAVPKPPRKPLGQAAVKLKKQSEVVPFDRYGREFPRVRTVFELVGVL